MRADRMIQAARDDHRLPQKISIIRIALFAEHPKNQLDLAHSAFGHVDVGILRANHVDRLP